MIVGGGKKRGDLGQVSPQDGGAEAEIERDSGQIRIFSGWIAAGAEAVAEVVMEQAGFDGVQVDEADRLAGVAGKEEVARLGVAVDRAGEQFSLRPRGFEYLCRLFSFGDKAVAEERCR